MPDFNQILAKLKAALETFALTAWFKKNVPAPVPSPRPITTTVPPGQKLYLLAKSKLGTDVSPADLAKDELGCAESVSALLHEAYRDVPGEILGTYDLRNVLASHSKFKSVVENDMGPGDVIICVTGEGKNPAMPHGHTGIVGKSWIMSNDSGTGKFIANYTYAQWGTRFAFRGGYPIHVYRRCA